MHRKGVALRAVECTWAPRVSPTKHRGLAGLEMMYSKGGFSPANLLMELQMGESEIFFPYQLQRLVFQQSVQVAVVWYSAGGGGENIRRHGVSKQ